MAEQMVLSGGPSLLHPRIFHKSFLLDSESKAHKGERETLKIALQIY